MSVGVQAPVYEMASVLFLDIVSYSLRSIEEQTELLTVLQQVVRDTAEYQAACPKQDLLSLPTGDGMALVFLRDPIGPAKCALEIAASLKSHPELKVRMGLHIGPVHRHADIRENDNVVGGGINIAQRVMDCGDAGHILVSQQVADVLQQLRGWRESLQDLGIHEVKHGVKVHLYNLCKDGLGNPALPAKLSGKVSVAPQRANRRWFIAAALAVVLAASALAFYEWTNRSVAGTHDPVVAVPERELHYYVMMQKYRDGKLYQDPVRVSGGRLFEKDYQIRLVFDSPQPGYLYILNEGPASSPDKPDLNALFPSPSVRDGSAKVEPGNDVQTPYFVFDNQKGVEKLWLIWANDAVPELQALTKWVNKNDRGAIRDTDQARAVLGLVNKFAATPVQSTEDAAKKETILKAAGSVLARQIRLDHD